MIDPALAGMLAGTLTFIAFFPYLFAMLKGKTIPNRASWLIWGVQGLVILGSYHAVGATNTIWDPLASEIGVLVILALAIRYGEGGWNGFDRLCLVGAGLGIALWWLFNSPLIALLLSMTVGAIGYLPTMKKAYQEPESEDHASWLMFSLASVLNVIAIGGQWAFAIAVYPVYVCLFTCAVFVLLVVPRANRPRAFPSSRKTKDRPGKS